MQPAHPTTNWRGGNDGGRSSNKSRAPSGNWRGEGKDSSGDVAAPASAPTVQQLAIHNRRDEIERMLNEQGDQLVNENPSAVRGRVVECLSWPLVHLGVGVGECRRVILP
jgi:hypothetical protein